MAVPGEVAGYWAARKKYGNKKISWRKILQPTIDLCREGIPVTETLAEVLRNKGANFSDPGMRAVFVNPGTGDVWKEGEFYTNPALADTLQILAEKGEWGAHSFYNGTIAEKLVKDIQQLGNNFNHYFSI